MEKGATFMRNIEYLFVLFFFLFSINLISQYRIVEEIKQIQELPSVVKDKLHDGLLIKEVIERNKEFLKGNLNLEDLKITVALYFEDFPKQEELQLLEQLNVNIYPSTWIPPLSNHPYGFMLADIYTNKFIEVLNIVAIKRIANTNEEYYPTDNRAAIKIRSDLVWLQGYTGTGVKVAVLDSGLDGFYEGTDLPNGYERRDYSNFPSSIDNNVENTVSGHGTHVAGSVLGRGLLSNNHNSSNGNTPFKGSAPNANLCFLKIGNDINASASANAMIAAIQSAVDTFNSKIISMSYGGWDAYHDGSSSIEQTIDWAFNRGVISFISAGNEGAARRHYSGTVNGLSYSAYIPITVTSSIKPVFNLVWFDGTERRNLTLKYYNSSFNEITQIQLYTTTESLRGTESQYSEALNNFSPGTYYLRVYNPSSTNTFFHLYGYYTTSVLFDASVADPNYTTNNPSNADYAISVGAYVSRFTWWNYLNNGPFSFTGQNGEDQIANFSSRGPRVDGINKPDIVAPGTAIISLRDTDVLTSPNNFWIDNDGINGGSVNYYVMQGTSMSCPITSGAAALYLNKYPSATPTEIKNALLNNTSKSLTESYPNPKWGYGKLDIFAAMNSVPVVDGHLNDPVYENLASFTSGRNGFGNDNDLKSLKYYTDGTSIYIGITGEITSTDNIVVFFNFSGYAGRGGNTLQNSGSDAGVFKHFSGAKMDFDVDFALAFNEGNSSTNFFIDACRYDLTTPVISSGYLGNVANQLGSSANFNLGSIFGGTGNMTVAYNKGFATDS
jgi:subtilisin family serine protease